MLETYTMMMNVKSVQRVKPSALGMRMSLITTVLVGSLRPAESAMAIMSSLPHDVGRQTPM